MLNYDVLSRKTLIFKSFTGLEVQEFDALYSKTQESHDSYEEKRLYREDRKRKIGAGHPFKLTLKDRLVMLLMYHRLYVTSTLLGFLFNLGQSNVLKNIRMLEPLAKEALPLPKKIHQRAGRLDLGYQGFKHAYVFEHVGLSEVEEEAQQGGGHVEPVVHQQHH